MKHRVKVPFVRIARKSFVRLIHRKSRPGLVCGLSISAPIVGKYSVFPIEKASGWADRTGWLSSGCLTTLRRRNFEHSADTRMQSHIPASHRTRARAHPSARRSRRRNVDTPRGWAVPCWRHILPSPSSSTGSVPSIARIRRPGQAAPASPRVIPWPVLG